jgi:hypothetical protein
MTRAVIWAAVGLVVSSAGLAIVSRVVDRRRARNELARWEPTGIKQTFEGHDQTLAARSAERARREAIAKRKLHAQRSQPGQRPEKLVNIKDRKAR